MKSTYARSRGFTIVELLIVIVVIAILAAISIVAYSGIQDRAKMSVVQNDLSNAKRKLMVFHSDNGSYPKNSTELTNAGLKISGASSYDMRASYSNFYYCADLNGENFSLAARASNSGATSYFITSASGIDTQASLISQGITCSKIGLTGTTAAAGAFSASGLTETGSLSAWLN